MPVGVIGVGCSMCSWPIDSMYLARIPAVNTILLTPRLATINSIVSRPSFLVCILALYLTRVRVMSSPARLLRQFCF